jgi:hypothetical protein
MHLTAQITAPQPIAGHEVTKDYITKTMVYPEADLEQGNSGKVVVGMHIDAQGVASNYTIKSSFSEAASPIAMHLVKTILWKPATNIGIPMDYDYEYEVDFSAKSYKRYWKRHERPEVPLGLEADTSYNVYEYRQLEEVARPYFADGGNMGQYIVNNMQFPAEAKAYFTISTEQVQRLKINDLTLDELKRHPYINYYQARAIVDYRRQHGRISDLSDLRLLRDFPEQAIERLRPYVVY